LKQNLLILVLFLKLQIGNREITNEDAAKYHLLNILEQAFNYRVIKGMNNDFRVGSRSDLIEENFANNRLDL